MHTHTHRVACTNCSNWNIQCKPHLCAGWNIQPNYRRDSADVPSAQRQSRPARASEPGNQTIGAAPVRDPGFSIVTPGDGAGCNDPAPAAPQLTHRQVLPPA
jgi:hypothetical protein